MTEPKNKDENKNSSHVNDTAKTDSTQKEMMAEDDIQSEDGGVSPHSFRDADYLSNDENLIEPDTLREADNVTGGLSESSDIGTSYQIISPDQSRIK